MYRCVHEYTCKSCKMPKKRLFKAFFLEKSLRLAKYVALVFPKFLLNTPEFSTTRAELAQKSVDAILDFGEKGFPGILVETIAIFINNLAAPANTIVFSLTHRLHLTQPQAYIFDPELPYWIIYRNQLFDSVCRKLDFDVFEVFRDRQLTNKLLSSSGECTFRPVRGSRLWHRL